MNEYFVKYSLMSKHEQVEVHSAFLKGGSAEKAWSNFLLKNPGKKVTKTRSFLTEQWEHTYQNDPLLIDIHKV
jgi:hypothetical protein